jgi:hypothetical protein
MALRRDRDPKGRPLAYVVTVKRTALVTDVFGPYSYFTTAEGDALAWGGTVEPLFNPDLHSGVESGT